MTGSLVRGVRHAKVYLVQFEQFCGLEVVESQKKESGKRAKMNIEGYSAVTVVSLVYVGMPCIFQKSTNCGIAITF